MENGTTNIMDKAICLVIERSFLGSTRSVSSSQVEVNADKTMVHVQKELFDCNELKAIWAADAKMDDWLNSRCLPSLLKRNARMLPIGLFNETNERLNKHIEERKQLVEAFCNVYDAEVAKSLERLGDLANSGDYPPIEEVRAAFRYRFNYVQFGPSEALKAINPQIFEAEKAKIEKQVVEAGEEIKKLMLQQFNELISHMVERLSPTADGKKKRFHKSGLDQLNDFFATFDFKNNLVNFDDLKAVVEKAKALSAGADPEVIRSNDQFRQQLQTGFEQIKSQIDTMVTEAPSRRIRFND